MIELKYRLMAMMTRSDHEQLMILVCLLLFALTLSVSAQTDEGDILTATKKASGVYRTFKEFRTNSPSITGQIKVTQKKVKLLNDQTGEYETYKGEKWGACVNDTVYFFQERLEVRNKPHFYKFKFLGRYCFFEDYGMYTIVPGVGAPLYPYDFEFVLNINNGKLYKLDKKIMRTILSKDQELLTEFERELFKGRSFEEYIRKFNERNLQDIKPVSQIVE